jgi:CheY-like chemotaxis protein
LDTTTILLVEDQILVRECLQAALEDAGHAVVAAPSGAEALAQLESSAAGLFGLVTDVNLGRGVNGWAVATRARELNPNLPIVYMTGGNAHEWAAYGVPDSIIVTKPFVPVEITVALAVLRMRVGSSPGSPLATH